MNVPGNIYRAIKAAFDQDVEDLGGVTAVAARTRVGPALISRYTSLSDQNINTHVPVDVLLDVMMELTRREGDSKALRLLADAAGFKLVPKAEAVEVGENFMKHLADITRATSAVQVDLLDAYSDGTLDGRERARIREGIRHASTQLAELDQDLSRAEGASVRSIRRSA